MSILDFHVRVYPTRKGGGQYANWKKNDLITKLKPMFETAQLRLCKDGCIRRTAQEDSVLWESPWWHARHLPCMRCYRDHHIKFNFFGYIPPRCLECWKVVAAPRTVLELKMLEEVQKELDIPGKVGIDLRMYTTRKYAGFWYTTSLDNGQHAYKLVREAVNDAISPDMPVLLKRGCTEFEMLNGPSDTWCISDDALELDKMIDTYTDFRAHTTQRSHGELAYNKVQQHWIDWAYMIGDDTYKEFTDQEPLYPAPVMYHDKDADAIKVQLAANRVTQLHRVPPAQVGLAFQGMGKVMQDTGLGRNALGRVMGFHDISPFNVQDHSEIT